MKKIFRGLLIMMIAIVTLTACSGPSSYSAEKCAALEQKIESKQELTDVDYTEMIDQLGAIVKVLKEKQDEMGDDQDKIKEFAKNNENKDMAKYVFGFGLYLDSHGDQLSNSNKRKLNKIISEMEQLK